MPPIVNTNLVSAPGGSLVPDASGLAQLIGNALQKKQANDLEDARLKQIEDAKSAQQISKTNAAQLLRVRGISDFQTQRKELAKLGQNAVAAGQDPSLFIEALNANNPDDLNLAITRAATAQGNADKLIEQGLMKEKAKSGLASAKTEILESGAVIQALPDGSVQVRDPSGEIVTGQARLDALSQSRQQALKTLQAESEIAVDTEGKKSEAKLKTQLSLKPQIEAAVAEARTIAADKGQVFTELNQMKAALPGLQSTVGALRELAPIATSTYGGRVFDAAVKESGFGATEGATARAKFIAIVNNQVLPLLKQTFGGSFSVQEGQELKSSMGDPNASPSEKMAQLDAFIEQKIRTIESKEAQLKQPQGVQNTGPNEGATATNPQTGQKVIFTNGEWQPAS
jgi:hypothetical protein